MFEACNVSGLLSRLPWAVKHVFDKDDCDRNEARAIVEALGLRVTHNQYSVEKSEEIYVVMSVLSTARRAIARKRFDCDPRTAEEIKRALRNASARESRLIDKWNANDPEGACKRLAAWTAKHPAFSGLYWAINNLYSSWVAREIVKNFGLVEDGFNFFADGLEEATVREEILRRAQTYCEQNRIVLEECDD